MTARWIGVRYKCSCRDEEVEFQMQERGADEDILDFMDRLRVEMTREHGERSPECRLRKVEYCRVPVSGEGVGVATGGLA